MNTKAVISSLSQYIPVLMADSGVPGLAVAFIEHGEIVWEEGFGYQSITSQTKVTSTTIFEAASLSKPVFAHGVLRLCERGVLALDTPLIYYYPFPYAEEGFNADDPLLKLVTVRQVLSHSGGFGNWGNNEVGKINFPPGKKFFYGGEGYVYLQRVVEHVMHSSLEEYMVSSIFQPLSMTSSSYIWHPSFEGRLANGQGERDAGVGSRWQEGLAPYTLYTTVHDFATLLTAMMYEGTGNASLLGKYWLREMVRPQIAVTDVLSWGLGWGIEKMPGEDYCWHWGDIGDFTSFAILSNISNCGLVIMTNSGKGLLLFKEITQQALGGEHPCFSYFTKG